MCTTCGCGVGDAHDGEGEDPERRWSRPVAVRPQDGGRADARAGRPAYRHAHSDHPVHEHDDMVLTSETLSARLLRIERDLLARNDAHASANRLYCQEHDIFALNLLSSPGSGKTAILCRSIAALRDEWPIVVIEGDQQSSRDADRIRACGVAAWQVNTGKACHLDAQRVGHALTDLSPNDGSLLFIENVGNLVCPAAFDLGEAHKVVILSVTEGDDKPLKYPDAFRAASLMLLNKIDLLPHVSFDTEQAIAYARRINPTLPVIALSATSGEGFAAWLAWLKAGRAGQPGSRDAVVAAQHAPRAHLDESLSAATRG